MNLDLTAYRPNSETIERFLSPDRDFPALPGGARSKYVLCSSPRCGSSLVASMLFSTGLAGDPLEYLNDRLLDAQRESGSVRLDNFDVGRNLAKWQERRTSPNGIFGMKLHYYQMRRAWHGRDQEAALYLRDYDHRILLTRRDKIAQAVSLYRAIATQAWTARIQNDTPRILEDHEFDPARVAELMAFLIKQELGWRSFLQNHELTFEELCYEELIEDYSTQSARLLGILGVDSAAIPPPQLTKQGRIDDPMIAQFKEFLGLSFKTPL